MLAGWGGRVSLEAIRAWLLACLERESGWAVRGVAVKQLAQLVPDRRQLLTPLIDDPHKEVQKSARYLAQKA